MTARYISLKELNMLVRDTIMTGMPDDYWVEAEISEIREVRGHCYMELIQKDPRTNTPVARASAKCWASSWVPVGRKFLMVTGQRLSAGMKVLMMVYANFHENYGFSWIVTDIDPTYTLGDMARKRREIVQELKRQGVFDLNKQLTLPLFAQRIAVVSSASAAGYGDFCHHLEDNVHGYVFTPVLFAAVMQGEGIERSVISALDEINACAEEFDCVVIIRGGGATSDLSGFDTLELAENVANFPLPVITGIGHDRDESVIDMVAHTSVKTPTAAAALLIDNLRHTDMLIDGMAERMAKAVDAMMKAETARLGMLTGSIPMLLSLYRERRMSAIGRLESRLFNTAVRMIDIAGMRWEGIEKRISPGIRNLLNREFTRLGSLSGRASAADPINILRRGYSITTIDGKVVRDASSLKVGTEVETRVEKGAFKAVVK